MNIEILEKLEELLVLKNNLKFQSAKRKYTNEKICGKQKEKAKTTMFKIITKRFSEHEIFSKYLSSTDKSDIELALVELTDTQFYRILYTLEAKGQEAKNNYEFDNAYDHIITNIKETALALGLTTVSNILVDIDVITDKNTKKTQVTNAIEELLLAVRTKIATTNKDLYKSKEVQDQIDTLRNQMLGITFLINSDENYQELCKKVDEFLTMEVNLARKAEKKQMKDEKEVTNKNPERINSNNNNSELIIAQPQTLTLQRTAASGKATKTINIKKIVAFGVAGAMVVGIAVGSYFLGKNSSKNNNQQTNKPDIPGTLDQNTDNILAEIEADADIVYANWSKLQSPYTRETIVELIKCLRGLDSTMSIEVADEILLEMLNIAIYPGVNNALAGSQYYETNELDFASLLSDDQEGIKAVENMENNLNGALTDQENLSNYAKEAFEDQAFLIGEQTTIDGLNLSENTITDPGVRLVWSRLAIGVNAIAGTLGEDFSVEIEGKTYTQSDINNSNVLEKIATEAKSDMGYTSKTINMN